MFKRILLPLDLSDRYRSAVDIAAGLAKQSGGEIVLLHVVEIIPGLDVDEERAFYGRLEKMAQKHLEGVSRRLRERKVPCRCEVTYGHRARQVAAQADELDADLIVMTAPRTGAGDPSGWGSLTWKVGALCKCPLLMVKQDVAVAGRARAQ